MPRRPRDALAPESSRPVKVLADDPSGAFEHISVKLERLPLTDQHVLQEQCDLNVVGTHPSHYSVRVSPVRIAAPGNTTPDERLPATLDGLGPPVDYAV